MFPGAMPQANKKERQLIKLFKQLSDADKDSLQAFAEFLVSRGDSPANEKQHTGSVQTIPGKPLSIDRPEKESVIKAIKRLSETYPMVDKENILHPISDLMTAHMLQGREASDVIDELETVFLKEYNTLQRILDKDNNENKN